MTFLNTLLLVVQLLSAIAMIALILLQRGKGADAGAAFGGGASSASLFGASGGANFLSRTTAVLATVFLATTLIMAGTGGASKSTGGSVLESAVPAPAATPAPKSDEKTVTPVDQIPGK